jgi:hypothetical protein
VSPGCRLSDRAVQGHRVGGRIVRPGVAYSAHAGPAVPDILLASP